MNVMNFYTSPNDSGGILWYLVDRPCVRPCARPNISLSVHPSVFSFPDDNLSKYQWILPIFVCALILWKSVVVFFFFFFFVFFVLIMGCYKNYI